MLKFQIIRSNILGMLVFQIVSSLLLTISSISKSFIFNIPSPHLLLPWVLINSLLLLISSILALSLSMAAPTLSKVN